jgi:hypothetical protein
MEVPVDAQSRRVPTLPGVIVGTATARRVDGGRRAHRHLDRESPAALCVEVTEADPVEEPGPIPGWPADAADEGGQREQASDEAGNRSGRRAQAFFFQKSRALSKAL